MLRLEGIVKTFSGTASLPAARPALDGVDLALRPGQFATVVGSNGAGKTTLLNIIAGSLLPDEGRVTIDGHDVTGWPEHRRAGWIGRVFQEPSAGTAASLTVEENLALALARGARRGLRAALDPERRKRMRDTLSTLGMGLENRMSARARHLSGGQRQALALLMATLRPPRLLLLDEHTASLDPQAAEAVLELTARMVAESSLTTIMVTHNLKYALMLGDRTLIMHRGRVLLDLDDAARRHMGVTDLMEAFRRACGDELSDDELVLAPSR